MLKFVIAMEVSSRLLAKAAVEKGFEFHLRCLNMRLNHQCFEDDLLILFVLLMFRQFKQ